jgi:microcompartment protein CcmK/EutM
MEKQSVYTYLNNKDVGAFQEDALLGRDSASASDDPEFASQIDAMMIDIVDSMRRQSEDELLRREVGSRLV